MIFKKKYEKLHKDNTVRSLMARWYLAHWTHNVADKPRDDVVYWKCALHYSETNAKAQQGKRTALVSKNET